MGSSPANLKRDPEFDHRHDELAELRALLLGQQIVELQQLQKRLDDPNLRAEELSQVLAKAVALSLKRDRGLQRSFHPIVEQALQISVARNPGLLATALAPIIGESVRKAVANAFRNMAENINLMLERSLSFESMKWRFEALRTGKSYGEIALLRSLRYKVQQVFLIHRETGLVLQHISAKGEGVSEAELVSGMLTAIQDFVRDSFTSKHSQDLETMQAGEFTIWVHHGPQALLAGTILGTPPPELRNVFARENELIHQEFAAQSVFVQRRCQRVRCRTSSSAEMPARANRPSQARRGLGVRAVGSFPAGIHCSRLPASSAQQPLGALSDATEQSARHRGHRRRAQLESLLGLGTARSYVA